MKEVIQGTLIPSIEDLDSRIQEAKEGKEIEALCFDTEFSQDMVLTQSSWKDILAKLLEVFPSLKYLSLKHQDIADDSLQRLKEFKGLQGLVFSHSKTRYKAFLQDLPSSIQHLELSHIPLEVFNQNLEVGVLLNRLEYLEALDLSSTYLIEIPKLAKPNLNLKRFIFNHSGDSRVYPYFCLKDLETIESNFPELEELNIFGSGFLPQSTRLCRILDKFSNRDSFIFYADSALNEYFELSQAKKQIQAPELRVEVAFSGEKAKGIKEVNFDQEKLHPRVPTPKTSQEEEPELIKAVEVHSRLGLKTALDVFTELRKWKDGF